MCLDFCSTKFEQPNTELVIEGFKVIVEYESDGWVSPLFPQFPRFPQFLGNPYEEWVEDNCNHLICGYGADYRTGFHVFKEYGGADYWSAARKRLIKRCYLTDITAIGLQDSYHVYVGRKIKVMK